MAMLITSTLLGGGAGAAIRMVFERRYGTGPRVPPSIAVTLALGLMAGGLAGLLYLVAQTSSTNLAAPDAMRFVSIMAVISVVGGLTVETVFRKLLGVDVVNTAPIAVRPDRTGPVPIDTKNP
jgi:drug/metabolite transporter (DMT)-like permease